MAIWEWLDSGSADKQLTEVQERPDPSSGAYGQTVFYDQRPPKITETIRAKGMTWTEYQAELAKIKTVATQYSYTVGATNETLTGYVIGVRQQRMKGAAYPAATAALPGGGANCLYQVDITLRIPPS